MRRVELMSGPRFEFQEKITGIDGIEARVAAWRGEGLP